MTGTEFGKWLDSRGISVSEAAAYFGVSEGSIYKWRSTPGVPDTKTQWVIDRMGEWAPAKSSETLERLSLEITREQFAEWNRAALLAGKIIYDWAADVLDAEAEEALDPTGLDRPSDPVSSVALVREPGTAYRPKKDGAA